MLIYYHVSANNMAKSSIDKGTLVFVHRKNAL